MQSVISSLPSPPSQLLASATDVLDLVEDVAITKGNSLKADLNAIVADMRKVRVAAAGHTSRVDWLCEYL